MQAPERDPSKEKGRGSCRALFAVRQSGLYQPMSFNIGSVRS